MKVGYRAQRVYVLAMMKLVGGLLQAASAADPELKQELAGFPDGLVIGMSVLGDRARLRLRKSGDRLVRLGDDDPARPELEIVFKHVAHAFLVLSFQEGTARAAANQRLVTHGDVALATRFVRCLNRMEAVTLPKIIAQRALKAYPPLPLGEKLMLSARTYGRLVTQTLGASR